MILVAMSSAAGRVADTGSLTTTALIVIAAFAVLVILGILWGARQKRIRVAGEREEQRRNEALADHPPAAPAQPLDAAEPVKVAAPVASEPQTAPEAVPKPAAAPKVSAAKPKSATRTAPAKVSSKPASEHEVGPASASKPAAKATPAPTANFTLTDVKGLGPKAVPLLADLGVADLAALAALDPARAAAIDGQLGALSGRLARDRWVEQAQLLTAGNVAEFEAAYGKL